MLIPLDRKNNTSAVASNEFLKRKTIKYNELKVQDVQDIANSVADDCWRSQRVYEELLEKLMWLNKFFGLE